MRYRWGFIEDEFVECHPIVEDTTALDFAKQTGEVFYRAKLNGTLSFRFEFDDILAKGYNYEHKIALQWYDESADEWKETWRGRFALTDCEINYDTNTINVQPETLDVYTKILDNAETEYNLVKLNARMQPVKIGIRACLQVYCRNDVKITNITGSGLWETDCDQIYDHLKITYHFDRIGNYVAVYLKAQFDGFDNVYEGVFGGEIDDWGVEFEMQGNVNVNGVLTPHKIHGNMMRLSDEAGRLYLFNEAGTTRYAILEFEVAGFEPTIYSLDNAEDVWGQWIQTFGRLLFRSEDSSIEWAGETIQLYDFPTDDIVDKNLNYNKVGAVPLSAIECIGSAEATLTPDSWGQNYLDWYFTRYKEPSKTFWSISPTTWKYGSVWVCPKIELFNICDLRTIADGYRLGSGSNSVLIKLFNKVCLDYEFFISRILNGRNDLGFSFIPVITPKSNVITSYYDTPAQKAPISLKMVLDMLKQAYQIYWAIDGNGNIHFEHIQFFENGWSYNEDETELLVDLESEIHTNTKNNKVFGQNVVKFDKQDMPNQYIFGWMDEQTRPFDGYAMVVTDNYVQKGLNEEKTIANFSTDIDYILATPSEISKDGFFLFACPAEDGVSDFSLKIERMNIKDEEGDVVEYALQNAEGAFAKIQKSLWRYNLSGENVEINNESSVALTTGNFKLQSVEFSDLAMAEILKDVNNCNKIIRTQQGNGHIKTISINLNSLRAKGDLLFNFVGRWYYLRGTALSCIFTITINGEQISIEVNNNTFLHKYKDAIESVTFDGANVVSVDFSDCDSLANLTSADSMFEDCDELVAVNFGGKHFSAVLSAQDMFAGCSSLTTLICPETSSWKADLDFSDCPNLTTESFYDLIKFLFLYNSGTHTITPNSTMWNNLDGTIQDDLIAKALAKGWTIAISAQYSLQGTSSASVVYATINGNAIEIDVVGGNWSYDYNTPITSISFTDDTNVQTINFSASDGLAGVTSLDNAFKNCSSLTSVDFTNCDISNVVSASDCFANCAALTNLTIPAGIWKPDVDFSACPLIVYAEMLDIIGGLFTYTSGVHTITWNTTYWDTLTQAQQQTISDAASAKGWQTNAVMVIYVIRGTSTNVNGTETFNIQFIDDGALSPSAAETITCAVDGDGNWEYQYVGKKIYSIQSFCAQNARITSINFDDADDFSACVMIGGNTYAPSGAFYQCTNLTYIALHKTLSNVVYAGGLFCECTALTNVDLSSATFESLVSAISMFRNCSSLTNITWSNTLNLNRLEKIGVQNSDEGMFENCGITNFVLRGQTFESVRVAAAAFYLPNAQVIDLHDATFENLQDAQVMFIGKASNQPTTHIDLSSATFASCTNSKRLFDRQVALTTLDVPQNSTAILRTSTAANAPMDLRYSPLSYQSMLNVANWLSDLTGYSAHTCTFKALVWNALSSAEQATIQGILQAKNWNLATA